MAGAPCTWARSAGKNSKSRRCVTCPSPRISPRDSLSGRIRFPSRNCNGRRPDSEIDAQANLASFAQPAWTFRYRGQLRLEDLWTILRQRDAPGGHIEFAGDGGYSAEQMNFNGRYTADRVTMKYQWFHPGNISAHGSYRADNHAVDLPDLEALILGGTATSHVHVNLPEAGFPRRNESARPGPASGDRRGK